MDNENMDLICRLCLGDSPDISILDSESSVLQQKILTLVNVEVRETDRVTKMICNPCLAKIEDLFDFKKSCEQSQFRLQNWISNHTPPSDSPVPVLNIKSEPVDEEEYVDITETEENLYIKSEPDDCHLEEENDYLEAPQLSPQYPFGQEDQSLLVPSRECEVAEHGIQLPRETCRICLKKFSNMWNRIRHEIHVHNYNSDDEEIHHETMPVLQKPVSGFNNTSDSNIVVSNKKSVPNSLIHTESEFRNYFIDLKKMLERFVCICCNLKFNTRKQLFSHLKKSSFNKQNYSCVHCWVIFPNHGQYMHHVRLGKSKPECHERERLILSGNLQAKVYQNFICTLCKYIFVDDKAIRYHMETKHSTSILPVTCTTCDCILETEEDFKEHLHNSCFFRIYCGICRNHFPNITDFDNHCLIHGDSNTGDKDNAVLINPAKLVSPPKLLYACHLCKNKYNNNLSLLKHLKIYHSNPNISVCKCCPDDSPTKYLPTSEFSQHLQSCHTKSEDENIIENKFSCNICNALFKTLNDWKVHQKVHAVRHPCSDCSAVFESSSELETHKRSHSLLKLKIIRYSDNSYVTSQQASKTDILVCRICDKFFKTKRELLDHLALHEKMPELDKSNDENVDKRYDCKKCGKSYKFKFSLDRHNCHVPDPEKSNRKIRSKSLPSSVPEDGSAKSKRHCTICNNTFKDYISFYRHNSKYHSNTTRVSKSGRKIKTETPDIPMFPCTLCSRKFTNAISLSNHSRIHNTQQNKSTNKKIKTEKDVTSAPIKKSSKGRIIKNPSASPRKKPHKCPNCNRHFSDIEALQQHILTHADPKMIPPDSKKLYPCIKCGKICQTMASLVVHVKYKHDDNKVSGKNKCSYCNRVFLHNLGLVIHQKTCNDTTKVNKVTKRGKHTCAICNRLFDTRFGLNAHMKFHVARHAQDVVVNIKSETPAKKKTPKKNEKKLEYSCTKCNLQFNEPLLLQKHLQIHINNNKTVNGMKIKRSKSLSADFKCQLCDLSFESQHSYISHKGWHGRKSAGSFPKYDCTLCKESFTRKNDLRSHLTIHKTQTEKEKIACDVCHKVFTYHGCLKKHIVAEHGSLASVQVKKSEKGYKCTQCNICFDNSKMLRLHIANHMNITV